MRRRHAVMRFAVSQRAETYGHSSALQKSSLHSVACSSQGQRQRILGPYDHTLTISVTFECIQGEHMTTLPLVGERLHFSKDICPVWNIRLQSQSIDHHGRAQGTPQALSLSAKTHLRLRFSSNLLPALPQIVLRPRGNPPISLPVRGCSNIRTRAGCSKFGRRRCRQCRTRHRGKMAERDLRTRLSAPEILDRQNRI